jgi:PIN domain nuclease of toxin-antitoxin system
VILLDTQVWMWWTTQNAQLPERIKSLLVRRREEGFGVSRFSCWEVAKKVERGKLGLGQDLDSWLDAAEAAPGVVMLDVTRAVLVESTRLPGNFHRDPADQIIVATARVHDLQLLSTDRDILAYPHVRTISV